MIRQAFLLILACSLLFASDIAACACSHHVEKEPVKADCHSHAPTTEATQVKTDENICDKTCICAVGQLSPYIASIAPSKEFKPFDELAKPTQGLIEIEFVALKGYTESSPDFVNDLSYSTTLKSLLPSRAPPRL